MIANDDTFYPRDYAQKMISYMDSNPLVAVASGNYANHKFFSPHGAGRFVRNSFFEKSIWHGYYPEQMGYESALLYEASRSGYLYAVIEDAKFEHTRTLGQMCKESAIAYLRISVLAFTESLSFTYLMTGNPNCPNPITNILLKQDSISWYC